METENESSRRSFYLSVIYGIWGLIGAVLSLPAFAYLFSSGRGATREEWVEVGDIGGLKPNAPEEMIFRRRRKDGWKIISEKTAAWVTRVSETEVVAFAPQCTHLGCGYHWDESNKNFLCPCHASTFDRDGSILSGPAPRPLDRYEARVDGSKLLVGRIVRSDESTLS